MSEPAQISAALPEAVSLRGRTILVEKLSQSHSRDLHAALHGPDCEALWRHLPTGPFPDEHAFATYVDARARASDPFSFAIVDMARARAVGVFSLMRIDAPNRVIETGGIIFSPALQKTFAATEAHYLLAKYVFETLRYRRYEWKCDDLNAPSKQAALRLGFTFEGVFRQHMIVKGRNRDTAWFSMLDGEWPARKAALEAWLDPANFDAAGKQKRALTDFRA
jgi:RimJ/RimL family protein N-acetyltransferase